MKNRAAVALITLILAAGISAETTERYLVATKRPFRAGALASVVRDARQGLVPREVHGFDAFDGFAADLTAAEAAELKRNASVRWVEPVLERHAFSQPARNLAAQTTPYGVDMIQARPTWVAKRQATINVVVVDTGIDYHHPELKAIYAGGYNILMRTDDPFDDAGHGTHVAGTIAAANNDSGVVGVSPDVRLWALKVLGSDGGGSSEGVIRAVDWIIEKKNAAGGNWVVNLSLGSSRASNAEREAFARGVASGILFVAASGNDSSETEVKPVSYPAAYDGVVTVGAIDEAKALASFSNQGPQLDVVAPGVDVLSTLPVGSGSIAWLLQGSRTLSGSALVGAKRGRVTAGYVYCGLGKTGEFPASVAGKIALIKRGEIRFSEKTRNAMDAGAIGVAVFNHDTSAIGWTLINEDDPTTQTYAWPVAIGISNADGEALAANNAGAITIANEPDDYGYYSGTSMASPHVAAAAALLWAVAPNATATEISGALTATAADLGTAGYDNVFGFGVINVLQAMTRLAPAAVNPPPPPPSTGRRILKRG